MSITILKKPNSNITYHVDAKMKFQHGYTGEVVFITQHFKTNGYNDSGFYEILGVDAQFSRVIKTIILKNVVTGKILECREGQWESLNVEEEQVA